MTDTYQRYLANKHGSGVGANLTEQGGHRVVDGILNAYSTSGQQVPASMQLRLEELRDIARSEFEVRGASANARHTLSVGGAYDALAVGRRERELVNGLLNGARGVMTEPDRVALQQARAQARTSEANANISEVNARVASQTEGDRATLSRQQVRAGEQALRNGELQYQTSLLQYELDQITARSQISAATRAEQAEQVMESLGDASTLDILEVVQADDPTLAAEMFGAGVGRDVQLEILTNRLARENAVMAASGQPLEAVGTTQQSGEAMLGMAALEIQRSERIISDHGDDLAGIVSGEFPLPEGATLRQLQSARNLQIQRETDRDRLAVDLLNDRLDVDGVTLGPQGASGQREDKVETGYRIMSTLPPAELQAMQEQIMAGEDVVLQVPHVDATLTLDNRQALSALQLWDTRQTALAQQGALRETQRQAAQTFSDTVTQVEDRIRASNFGIVPQVVQQAIAKERAELANIAFGEGSVDQLTSSISRIEAAMREAQMGEEQIATIVHDRFQSDMQVIDGFTAMLGQSPDPGRQTQVGAAFLAQLENRLEQSGHVLDSAALRELHKTLSSDELSAKDKHDEIERSLGVPPAELASMMQTTLVSANFNQGLSLFMDRITASPEAGGLGTLDTETAQSLQVSIQRAVRKRIENGQPIGTEDYLNLVQTVSTAFTETPEQRKALMNTFYEALVDIDGSTLFRRVDGTVSSDELSLFSTILTMSETNLPASGPGSVPLSELPEVLGRVMEDSIDRSVLGHQRIPKANQQTAIIASTVAALLEFEARQEAGSTGQFNPNVSLLNNADKFSAFVLTGRGVDSAQSIFKHNPALTSRVIELVSDSVLSTPVPKRSWYNILNANDSFSLKEISGMVDMEAIMQDATIQQLIGLQ